MKILGIDPGLAKIGWGIIETSENKKTVIVEYGCLSTSKSESMACRLGHIYRGISEIINKFSPEEAAVEEIFFASNAKTAINVAQARGVIVVALGNSGIRVNGYTPLEIKQALVGYGRARKEQVQYMVQNFLDMDRIPSSDHAADALAAALCHESSRKLKVIMTGKE
ncbi:MAG: crossover junction endodeoxyribonuclease RuvC [Elusimicrobiota bacterium]